MPKIEQTLGDVNVRAHTFRFITPRTTESLHVPNPCGICHADKPVNWAEGVLKTWGTVSPRQISGLPSLEVK